MTTIQVHPDHLSSGLWTDQGTATSPEILNLEPSTALIALKYWVWIWEFKITKGTLSNQAAQQWLKDGETITHALNNTYGNQYQFNYTVTEQDIQPE